MGYWGIGIKVENKVIEVLERLEFMHLSEDTVSAFQELWLSFLKKKVIYDDFFSFKF